MSGRSPVTSPAVTIVGTGALGSLLATHLAPLARVTLYGHWREQLAVVRRRGLRLITPEGDERQIRIDVADKPEDVPISAIVLVAVKSHQTNVAAGATATFLADEGLAVTLQNGYGNLEILADAIGAGRSALGSTTEGATMLGPGVVQHGGRGITTLSSPPALSRQAVHLLSVLQGMLEAAGFETQRSADPQSLLWGKLVINAGINPLTALLGKPNGFLADDDDARRLMRRAASEAAQVAQALNVSLPFADAGAAALAVARNTADNHSSMLQDVQKGRPTEIDAICGAVHRLGEAHGIPTPVNRALLNLVTQKTNGVAWQDAVASLPGDLPKQFGRLLDTVH